MQPKLNVAWGHIFYTEIEILNPWSRDTEKLRQTKGPSIKDVGPFLAFFDTPLPHIGQYRILNDPP